MPAKYLPTNRDQKAQARYLRLQDEAKRRKAAASKAPKPTPPQNPPAGERPAMERD